MIDYIEKAKAFAMMAHKGQTDKAGEDYFTAHVAVVADGEVHGVLINSTMYLRESEIKQVARLIKDEKLRNRVLTLMRSHRRIVSAPEKENRNIREIASAQMLGQG